MKLDRRLMLVLLLSLVASGCARQVMRSRDHGIVAIPSNSNLFWPFDYRNQADRIMASHFPQGYEIVREEETVIGQTVDIEEENVSNKLVDLGPLEVGASTTRAKETTTDNTEWRIYYQRR